MKLNRVPRLSPSVIALIGKLKEGERLRVVKVDDELHVYMKGSKEVVRKSTFKVLLRNNLLTRVNRPHKGTIEGTFTIRKER